MIEMKNLNSVLTDFDLIKMKVKLEGTYLHVIDINTSCPMK